MLILFSFNLHPTPNTLSHYSHPSFTLIYWGHSVQCISVAKEEGPRTEMFYTIVKVNTMFICSKQNKFGCNNTVMNIYSISLTLWFISNLTPNMLLHNTNLYAMQVKSLSYLHHKLTYLYLGWHCTPVACTQHWQQCHPKLHEYCEWYIIHNTHVIFMWLIPNHTPNHAITSYSSILPGQPYN